MAHQDGLLKRLPRYIVPSVAPAIALALAESAAEAAERAAMSARKAATKAHEAARRKRNIDLAAADEAVSAARVVETNARDRHEDRDGSAR
jgi:hypothetical protein